MPPSPFIAFSKYKVNHKHTLSLCDTFSVSSELKKDEYPKKQKVRNLYQASYFQYVVQLVFTRSYLEASGI